MTSHAHLSVISRGTDSEMLRIGAVLGMKVEVEGRGDLEVALSSMLVAGASAPSRTLDLIGHSTADEHLLVLGEWMVDLRRPAVNAFFRGLVDEEVFPRLGIEAVRLLGCETAGTEVGRATICRLAQLLGIEVYGTTTLVTAAHYDRDGFRVECEHALVSASQLRGEGASRELVPAGAPYARTLDIEMLPAYTLAMLEPRRALDLATAGSLLRLVRRHEGARMLSAPPVRYRLALPATTSGTYVALDVLEGGAFVQVYPDGDRTSVVFPVGDARALLELVTP